MLDDGRRARRQLDDDQIREIGNLYATGEWTQKQLANAFSVSITAITRSLDYYDAHLKTKER